jgi:NhaA family Na+:H+ antiporter
MYGIMPVFAFANAGVELSGDALAGAAGPVGAGIFLGLLAGKLIGITGFSYVAVRLGWAALPEHSDWRQIIGAALLGGVGFTMSLFIGGLAFTDAGLFDSARIGIFVASLVAGVGGYVVLRLSTPDNSGTEPKAS